MDNSQTRPDDDFIRPNVSKRLILIVGIAISLLILITSAGQIQQSYDNLWTKSLLTGSTDRFTYGPSITGAGATPYITAVGLYNNNSDLMAVAKLARPLKKITGLPMTFKVQIDI